MKLKELFLDPHPENDESHSATRYAWQGYDVTRKEWYRGQVRKGISIFMREMLAAAIVMVPLIIAVILVEVL